MNFNVNQARQVYVVKSLSEAKNLMSDKTLASAVSDGKVDLEKLNESEWKFDFGTTKKPGPVSDLIKECHVLHANYTKAEDMKLPVAKVTVKMGISEVVPGQDYAIKVVLRQAHTLADEDRVPVVGYIKAGLSSTAEDILKGIAESLQKNLKNEYEQPFTVEAAADSITITGVERAWELGKGMSRSTDFDVYAIPIRYSGIEVDWADIKKTQEKTIPNGHMMADLEYFAIGERGDQYRDNCIHFPSIKPDLKVDPSKEYDCLTIHYYDEHNTSFKSEKDIQILVEKA